MKTTNTMPFIAAILIFLTGCSFLKDASSESLEKWGFDAGMTLLSVAPSSADALGKAKWGWYVYGVLEQVAGTPNASEPMLKNLLNKAIPNDGPAWTRLASQAIQAGLSQFKGKLVDNIRHFAKGFGDAMSTVIPPSTGT